LNTPCDFPIPMAPAALPPPSCYCRLRSVLLFCVRKLRGGSHACSIMFAISLNGYSLRRVILTVLATWWHTVYAHNANHSRQECLTWLFPNSASDSASNLACAARAAPDKAPGFRDRYASSGAESR